MSSVPILTIPETFYDPSRYGSGRRRKSRLLVYLVKLTRGSAFLVIAAYLLGIFAIRPLLELNGSRRLEFLEKCRQNLRDSYLKMIGRVEHIPTVPMRKKDGSNGFYMDAVCQTEESHMVSLHPPSADTKDIAEEDSGASQEPQLLDTLRRLYSRLNEATSYSVAEIPHYKLLDFSLKDLQNKVNLTYFNHDEMFSVELDKGAGNRKKNMAIEIRNEIRSMKGLITSGQV